MATKEQMDIVAARIVNNPAPFFKRMSESEAGIKAVMKILYDSGGEATAGEISDSLGVSTARVAALLKKMSCRGLVEKKRGILDARVTNVKLTELGKKISSETRCDIEGLMNAVIDEVGFDKVMELLDTADKINEIARNYKFRH